jgi:hypothetical protein
MQQRNVVLIPGTDPFELKPVPKSRNKKMVIGYSIIVEGNDAVLQIRQDILNLIKDHGDWELTNVITDYQKTESQYRTRANFNQILLALKNRELDVLVIHSGGELEYAIADASLLCWIFRFRNIKCYIIHENTLLPSKNYLRKLL